MFKMAFDEITSAAIELGFERVSSDQRAALEAFMNGFDVFVCLPTGSGKSLYATGLCLRCSTDERERRMGQ